MADLKLVRCAVYTRKSSEEGLEQSFNSLHAQREACEAYILSQKHEGWLLVSTAYDDGGFSGGSMERPGLKALMADVEAGLIDTVVVYKVDRLTRSLADFAKMVELFDSRSVSFVSVTQAFNTTTSMGRLTLNVLLSFAQFEREVTGERIRDKIAQSKAKGMWMGGAVPLGYDVVGRQLLVNELEAEQVRTLFQAYLELRAVDDVVAAAEKLGIKSKTRYRIGAKTGGTKLGRASLYRIFANPIYVGEIGHKGQRYPGQHAAIVDRPIHDAVQDLLAANRRKARGTSTEPSTPMLAGLVIDPDGRRLTGTYTRKGQRRYRYYAGGGLRIPAEELETLVTDALVEHLGTPAKLASILPLVEQLDGTMIAKAATTATSLRRAATGQLREIAAALINQVKVLPTTVSIALDLAALGASGTTSISVAATIGRSRARLTLVVPGPVQPRPDPALIGLVAQARGWFEALASGNAATMSELAATAGVTEANIRNSIGAAFLAPDLVESIVEGRQPLALTAHRLRELLPLPNAWTEQRALIAALN